MDQGSIETLEVKIDAVGQRMVNIEAMMTKMADALVQIARVEERLQGNSIALDRAFTALSDLAVRLDTLADTFDARIKTLENAQPVQNLVSHWVMIAAAGALGLALGVKLL